MTILKTTFLPAALLAALLPLCPLSSPAATFGPGKVQLIAGAGGAGGEVVLDAPGKQVSLRFVADRDGPLTEVKFASRIGVGWAGPQGKMFEVSLFSDVQGKPNRRIAAASEIVPTTPGARAREAVFKAVPLKAGQAYHLVIGMPEASATKQISVTYFVFDSRSLPLDSYDMETPAAGRDVLVSSDGGATWASVSQGATGCMSVAVGGYLQGWAYTNSYDARLWNVPGGTQQVLMQNFRFTTKGQGSVGQVGTVSFQVRSQGGLAGTTVPLRARLIDLVSGKVIGTANVPVDFADAGHFFRVDAPFQNVALKDGDYYVLSIDIATPVGASPADYLFIRTFNWGYGEPSLMAVSWQGTEHSLIQAPGLDPAAGQAVTKIDMPFLIEYTPGR